MVIINYAVTIIILLKEILLTVKQL